MSCTTFIDARHLRSGIGEYTFNLIRRLHEDHGWPLHCLTNSADQMRIKRMCRRVSVSDAPIYSLREQLVLARVAWGESVIHIPHYNVPLAVTGRMAVTVHDLTHLVFPGYRDSLKARLYARPMLNCACRRADRIITVSEYSKSCIVQHLGVAPDKIAVIYNGVSKVFNSEGRDASQAAVLARHQIEDPYLLYVGNLKPHKNLPCLFEGFAQAHKQLGSPLKLVIVSQDDPDTINLRKLAARLEIEPLFIRGAGTDHLADLYRAADALVVPSFEEGFCLPLVEAMASGTPVIASNVASLPEIAGDAAVYFDPHNHDELSQLIVRLLTEPGASDSLRARGAMRARRYSWHDAAEKHIAIYKQLVGLSAASDEDETVAGTEAAHAIYEAEIKSRANARG